MNVTRCTGMLLGALLLLLAAQPAWALRCGTHIVGQGESAANVRKECGAPFFVDRYARSPGVDVTVPGAPGAVVTVESWYYNFGPQRLMVPLDFSGGTLAREQTLGYGFVGSGGPCAFNDVTSGMSVATLIGRCGMPASRARNPLAVAVGLGERAPAWSETWTYPADGSDPAFVVDTQDGRVTDVRIRH